MIVIKNEKLRKSLNVLLPYLLIPALVIAGAMLLKGKQYLLLSTGVAALAVLFFITGFENRKTGTRRMVIVAVMAALCVVGRFVPLFKPVTALTILTAIYLGGEAGFLTGALAAVLSNFYFGQGPWTPFQMMAWGAVGLGAGLLHKPLKSSRALLLCYGVGCGVVYSFAMDIWTVLWYDGGLNWQLYAAAIATALPHTLLYAASNFAFLWICARPFGEKLERVCLKYGV